MIWVFYLRFTVPVLASSTAPRSSPTKSKTRRSPISSRARSRKGPCWSASTWPTWPAPSSSCCLRRHRLPAAIVPLRGSLGGSFIDLLKDLALLAVGLAVYGAVFAFIGARFKRPLLVGLIFIFGWEQAALAFPGYLKKFTVAYYLQAMVPHAMPNDSVVSLIQGIFRETPSLGRAWCGWRDSRLFLWAAAVSVERKEYVLEQ
jgi:hypothetical protein